MVTYYAYFDVAGVQSLFYVSDSPGGGLYLLSGIVRPCVNGAGTFDFSVSSENAIYAAMTKDNFRNVRVDVYQRENGGSPACVFSGYPVSLSYDAYNVLTVSCDGLLSVLDSIIVQPFTYPGTGQQATPDGYFAFLVQQTNSAAFHLGSSYTNLLTAGTVTLEDAEQAVYREYTTPTSALDLLKHLTDTCGGYLVPRYAAGSFVLDWMAEPTAVSQQNIEQGQNLIDLSTELDASGYYSGIYAVGDELDGVVVTLPWTNTATAQTGGGYLFRGAFYRSDADIQQHARVAYVKYEGITTQAGLLRAVKADLRKHSKVQRITSVTAADLGAVSDLPTFKLFESVRIVSPQNMGIHDINSAFFISELAIDLCNPENCEVIVDAQAPTLTSMTQGGSGSVSPGRSFYQAGDRISEYTIWTAGYCTSSKTNVRFNIPLTKPVYAAGVSVSCSLTLRQDGNYTHGSGSSTAVTPSSVVASLTPSGISIYCVMSDTTNAVNNAPIAIAAQVAITFN